MEVFKNLHMYECICIPTEIFNSTEQNIDLLITKQKKQPWNENKTKDLHQLRTHKFK